MNNENNNIENNDNSFLPGVNNNDNNFLPGFDNTMDNSNQSQPNGPQFNQFSMNQVPNMDPNQFDMNQGPNMAPNQFDMNQVPNMAPNQFDMNQVPNMDPNQFNMNQVSNMDPNQFNMNQVPNMDPNQFNMNQVPNMDPNQFDMNQVPNMDPNQFNMNQVPNMNPNQFDMNQGPNSEFNPDMNQNMNQDFNQDQYSDYTDDFTRTWMGSIYNKATSKKFNWCAALFGPAYLFYRKVYLTGSLATLIFIIINVIFALLKLENPFIMIGVDAILCLIYFFGLGLGFYPIYKDFVHKQLEKYKKQFADNDQLVAVASKKGGTSIAGLIVYFLVVTIVSSAISFMSFGSLLSGLKPQTPQTPTLNQTTNANEVQENLTDEFNFVDNYVISYPIDTWTVGTDKKSLINGNYSLSYTITYKSTDLGVSDMSSADGRTSVLKIINDSMTTLATTNNLHMEPAESFVRKNDVYYTYIDMSSDVEITRYYFILVPDDNILFQFELSVDDTAIDYDTNTDVNNMLTSITSSLDESESNNTISSSNEITNDITNSIAVNDTNSVNTTTSNTVEEMNNTISNSLPSANDVIDDNSVNSTSENTTNNTTSSSLGILQDID